MPEFQEGQILEHTEMPEIGRFRAERVTQDHISVVLGRAGGREVKTFKLPNAFLVVSPDQAQEDFEHPAVKRGAAKAKTKKATTRQGLPFEGAHTLFIAKYPLGFEDPGYIKDERAYKERALAVWRENFSDQNLKTLRAVGDPAGVARAFNNVHKVIELMHPVGEWVPFHDALAASPGAFDLAEKYGQVVSEGGFTEGSFNGLLESFDQIGLGRPKWTVFTYWPYVASTRGFPFVKPTLIHNASAGLGVASNYKPVANWLTYHTQAMVLYELHWQKLEPLGARDWVDVQTFLWIGWRG